jgi:transposase-like protein
LGSPRRDARAAKQFFTAAIALTGTEPTEVMTDRARIYPGVPDVVLRGAFHSVAQYANNAVEADHRRLKAGCDR